MAIFEILSSHCILPLAKDKLLITSLQTRTYTDSHLGPERDQRVVDSEGNSSYSSTALGMDSRPASPAHSKEGSIKTKGFSLNDEPERVPHQRWCSNKKGAPRPPRETEMIQGRLTAENKIAPAGHSWYAYKRHGDYSSW